MTTPAERRLETVEKKLRAAIREAIQVGDFFTDNSVKMYTSYTDAGGVLYYDELRNEELAAMAAEVKS